MLLFFSSDGIVSKSGLFAGLSIITKGSEAVSLKAFDDYSQEQFDEMLEESRQQIPVEIAQGPLSEGKFDFKKLVICFNSATEFAMKLNRTERSKFLRKLRKLIKDDEVRVIEIPKSSLPEEFDNLVDGLLESKQIRDLKIPVDKLPDLPENVNHDNFPEEGKIAFALSMYIDEIMKVKDTE